MSKILKAAADIGNQIGGRKTYSGALKWWRGKHKGLDWRLEFDESDNTLDIQVRPRNLSPTGNKTFEISATEFPVFTGDANIKYESSSQFISEVADRAKAKLEEQVLREVIRKELSHLL